MQIIIILSLLTLLPKVTGTAAERITPLIRTWEKPIPNQAVPDGLDSMTASNCGGCHTAIYDEWQQSTHALALRDPQFQAEWKKDNVFVCANCHIPLQNQQEFIVTGLINGDYRKPVKVPNPKFDKELQSEAITCAACHVRDGKIIGPFADAQAPHATVQDTNFLSERLCITCHNAVDTLSPSLVCTFETGDEWMANRAVLGGKTCITCHMPEVQRPLVQGFDVRRVRKHHFAGSGIPKLPGMDVIGLQGLELIADSVRTACGAGDVLRYSIRLRNSYAGHNVPTGDPERFFIIAMRVKNADGTVLKENQYRIGEEWQWYPVAKKLSDNNVKPGEERTYTIEYRVPRNVPLTLGIEITKHRMTVENARADKILGIYPLSAPVYTRTFPIPMR